MRKRAKKRGLGPEIHDRLLATLTAEQRTALVAILTRYQAGQPLRRRDVGLLGVHLSRLPHGQIADLFHVTAQTVYNWVENGCPRTADGTYDLYQVHQWLVKREPGGGRVGGTLLEQKMRAEIRYKEAQVERIRSESVDRSYHEAVLCSRGQALKTFLEQTMPLNSYHFVNLNLDEARTRLLALATEMMDAWTNAGTAAERRATPAAKAG